MNKNYQAEIYMLDSIYLNFTEEEIRNNSENICRLAREKLAQKILEDVGGEITKKFKINIGEEIDLESKKKENEPSFINKLKAIHFDNIPEIFHSLLEKSKNGLMNFATQSKREEKIWSKTASGKFLPSNIYPIEDTKSSFSKKDDEESPEENKSLTNSDGEIFPQFNLDFKLKNSLKIKMNNENKEGHLLDLLVCDNFKESYESSLSKTGMEGDDSTICEHISKNYKVAVLFGNISYSIGLYDKSIQFYERALDILENETQNTFEVIHLMHMALLQNNIGKSFINLLKINEGLNYLLIAAENIMKIEETDKTFIDNLSYEFCLLKLNILFNITESYYYIENYERSLFFLQEAELIIFKHIKIFRENENLKVLARYYNDKGKIEMQTSELKPALENFNKTLEIIFKYQNNNPNEKEAQTFLADVFNNISNVQSKLLNNEEALININKSLQIRKNIYGDENLRTIITYTNLGYIYHSMKQKKNALDTLLQAFDICEKNKDIEEIFKAVLYRALGQCYFVLGNEVKGLSNYTKANMIYKKYYQEKQIPQSELNMVIQNMYGLITI